MQLRLMTAIPFLVVAAACATSAPTATSLPGVDPQALAMTDDVWRLSAREASFGTHLGRDAIHLHGGYAHLRDVLLRDGTIDVDIAADDGVNFTGVAWHLQDEGTFDKFYLRPFLSGGREASQYTPFFNHISGWQTYHGPRFNRRVVVRRDRWTHLRIVLSGKRADIFVDDMSTPLLHIDPLRFDEEIGGVALTNEPVDDSMPTVGAWFSNVRVTPVSTPPTLIGSTTPIVIDPGRVPTFFVSPTFDSATLGDVAPPASSLSWTALPSEADGLANLARLSPVGPGHDTVFARVVVRSDAARRVQLRYGFSERLQIYVDGKRVVSSDATWHQRDVTFQGVVGLNDALSFDVAAGDTEVWFAVSENLVMRGGWAVQAVFVDATGLTFIDPLMASDVPATLR